MKLREGICVLKLMEEHAMNSVKYDLRRDYNKTKVEILLTDTQLKVLPEKINVKALCMLQDKEYEYV
jgi:hypothetical protein